MQTIKNVSILLTFLIMVGLWAGCSPAPPPVTVEDSESLDAIDRTPQDESFNPLNLDEEDVIVLPPSKLKPSPSRSEEQVEPTATTAELREVPGFRVQIFVTREEFEARQMEEEALLEFEESIYLSFDSPNYKIRVGDCQTRAEASELRQKAVKLGYRDAWVVQCKIMTAVH